MLYFVRFLPNKYKKAKLICNGISIKRNMRTLKLLRPKAPFVCFQTNPVLSYAQDHHF